MSETKAQCTLCLREYTINVYKNYENMKNHLAKKHGIAIEKGNLKSTYDFETEKWVTHLIC